MGKFNAVSQEEHESLGLDGDVNFDTEAGIDNSATINNDTSLFKYTYVSPRTKKILCATITGALLIIVGYVAIGGRGNNGGRGQWPPPLVEEEDYAENNLSKNRPPVQLKMDLLDATDYTQRTEMTTSSKLNFNGESFAETVHMTTENSFNVNVWHDYYDGDEEGLKVDVTFTHIAVTTQDSGGDYTYYNSYAQNGDTDFDAVLETMIGETASVEISSDFTIVEEEDSQNNLEEMEQEYSLGTTTGLSAMDQVNQILNLLSYLPPTDGISMAQPGDSWDVLFETDIVFSGTSTLAGYLKYNGFDCAVLKSTAAVEDDLDSEIGDDMLGTSLEIESGNVESVIFWDVKYNIPRYAKSVISLTTDIENIDGVDGILTDDADNFVMPMTETIEVYFAPN
jgi:hypothetical protein